VATAVATAVATEAETGDIVAIEEMIGVFDTNQFVSAILEALSLHGQDCCIWKRLWELSN
jgi:hypothetical protein